LAAGTHTVVGVFTPTAANFVASTSNTVTQNISDFTIAVTPASQTIARGTANSYTLTLVSLGQFAGTTSLTCTGAPTNVSCTLSPTQLTFVGGDTQQATATITVASNAAVSTKTLTFKGTSGTLSHTVTATLVIQ